MKKIFTLGFAKKAVLVLFVFFGVSLGFKLDFGKKNSANPLPIRLNVSHLQPLHASADNWGFVRGSATWARGNSLFMDELIYNIQQVFPVGSTVDITAPLVSNGQTFTARVILNDPSGAKIPAITPTTIQIGRTVQYPNYFGLKDASNNMALQFYFTDNPRTDSRGAAGYYRLDRLNPTEFPGASAIIETYVTDPAVTPVADPLFIQTYSWSGPLGNSSFSQAVKAGRVILEEMDNGDVFCFKTVVKVSGTYDYTSGTDGAGVGLCPAASSYEYYKLAYSQNLTGALTVTAKSGWEDNAVSNNSTFCGLLNINYGLFNVNGFVADGVASGTITSNYPDYIAASRVDGLYARIGTLGKSGGDGTTTSPQYSVWDDTQKGTIDSVEGWLTTFPAAPL